MSPIFKINISQYEREQRLRVSDNLRERKQSGNSTYERDRKRILVSKSQDKRPLGKHKCKWEENIKTDLTETEYKGRDGTELAENRFQWRHFVNAD
jgi:hypothetical protein